MLVLSEKTEMLAQRLAAVLNVPVDDAVRRALEEKAHGEGLALDDAAESRREAAERRRNATWEVLRQIDDLPSLDHRSPGLIAQDLSDP